MVNLKPIQIGLHIGRQSGDQPNFRCGQEIYQSVTRLADIYNYEVEQRNGQRFFGPPLHSTLPTPPKECEVFIGCIPRNVFEDAIVPMLLMAGKLYLFRLMMDFNGYNRGFGFALFEKPEHAQQACKLVNGYEIHPGKTLVCLPCDDNNTLYLGGICNKTPQEIIAIIFTKTPRVTSIAVTLPDVRNKRYAVMRFSSHREAALARRFYLVNNYELWRSKSQVIIDWKSRHDVEIPSCAVIGSYYLTSIGCYRSSMHNIAAYSAFIGAMIAVSAIMATMVKENRHPLFEDILLGTYGALSMLACYFFYGKMGSCRCSSMLSPEAVMTMASGISGISMVSETAYKYVDQK